jgi:predicted dienelactone hydrolase
MRLVTFLAPTALWSVLAALALLLPLGDHVARAQPVQALAQAPAQANVGFQVIQVPDGQGQPIEVGLWYPTTAPATGPARGMGDLPVALGAPLDGASLPLVVMSHGNGGWFGGHYDTAIALAKAGFVVAALTHTGDNYKDQSRATDMANRPRQLHVLIDYMLGTWAQHDRLDPARVGAFGFSSGGFTVLAEAGGEPDMTRVAAHCRDYPQHYDCQLLTRTPPPAAATDPGAPNPWTHDARVRAVVSAAPALGYTFTAQSLGRLTLPIQLWRAADDEILVDPFHASAVRAALKGPVDYRVVPGAGHFDFLTPCNAEIAKARPVLCTSAPGFDRVAFHRTLNAAVVAFFTQELARP